MGRKPQSEIIITDSAKAMQALAAKTKAEEAQRELTIQQADDQYGDGQPYERIRLQNEVIFYQNEMANSMLEIGKRLIRLKAHEGHGGFKLALEQIGMAWRTANYAMVAAKKFSNSHTCANLGVSKIRALSVLEDDEIQDLDEGKEAAGMTMDEIDTMTVKELKAKLREEKNSRKKERDAQEKVISAKNKKIDEIEQQLRYQQPPTKEEFAQAQLNELKKALFRQIGEASHVIHELIKIIDKAQQIPNVTIIQLQEFINVEPEDFLSSIFEYTDRLDEMIENIRPQKAEEYSVEIADEDKVCTNCL